MKRTPKYWNKTNVQSGHIWREMCMPRDEIWTPNPISYCADKCFTIRLLRHPKAYLQTVQEFKYRDWRFTYTVGWSEWLTAMNTEISASIQGSLCRHLYRVGSTRLHYPRITVCTHIIDMYKHSQVFHRTWVEIFTMATVVRHCW